MRTRYFVVVLVLAVISLLFAVKARMPVNPSTPQEQAVVPSGVTSTQQSGAQNVPTTTPPKQTKSVTVVASATTPATAELIVGTERFALTDPAGSTLKDAMDQLQREGSFRYAYREYAGLGDFVTEIQGRASDSSHYWILYVNRKQADTGIASTHIRSGDVIEWKLEKSY